MLAYGLELGLDAIGTVMGLITIPMALLSAGSIAAGLALAVRGDWHVLLLGVALFALCSVLARLLERLVVRVDDAAAIALERQLRGRARAVAVVSGAVPVGVMLLTEVLFLNAILASGSASPALLVWLWGYGVATGPWTLFAQQVSRFRRTLVGIRAYAGHIALWLFSWLALEWNAPIEVAVAAMLVPAVLPFTVGFLLALADRDAIRNVRV